MEPAYIAHRLHVCLITGRTKERVLNMLFQMKKAIFVSAALNAYQALNIDFLKSLSLYVYIRFWEQKANNYYIKQKKRASTGMTSTIKVKTFPADALHAIIFKMSGSNYRVQYASTQGLIIKALFQPDLAIHISLAAACCIILLLHNSSDITNSSAYLRSYHMYSASDTISFRLSWVARICRYYLCAVRTIPLYIMSAASDRNIIFCFSFLFQVHPLCTIMLYTLYRTFVLFVNS